MTDSATPDQYHNFIDQTETEIRSAELQTVPLVIGIVAGEVSGDSLGADFMQQMNNLRGDIVWVGVGGTKMQAQGLHSIFPLERLAVMGLVEVMAQLPDLLKARRELLSAFKAADIDWFIGIDAPDFNLRVAKKLKPQGVFCVQYVSLLFGHGVSHVFIILKRRPTLCCVCSPLSYPFMSVIIIQQYALVIRCCVRSIKHY